MASFLCAVPQLSLIFICVCSLNLDPFLRSESGRYEKPSSSLIYSHLKFILLEKGIWGVGMDGLLLGTQ